jgi:HAE1 family hydrophobic/amphiphilic exporter-1
VAGQIFRDQALTVTFSLAVSLVVALTFTPMAAAFGSAGRQPPGEPLSWYRSWARFAGTGNIVARGLRLSGLFLTIGLIMAVIRFFKLMLVGLKYLALWLLWPLTWSFEKVFPWLQGAYARILTVALRHRFSVLLVALLIAAGAGVLWPRLGSELVPPLSRGEFTLAFELPEGTPLGRTDAIISSVEKDLAELPGIDLVVGGVGISREANTSAQRRKENRAEVQVKLTEATALAEAAVLEDIRGVLQKHPDMRMKVRRQSLLAFGAPVEVNVYGYNLGDLQATADEVLARLKDVPGLRDLRLGMVPGSPEVQVTFDRDKLNRYGLSLGTVSETVRGKVRGTVASRFRDRERHVDIRVLNSDDQRNTLTAVKDLIVTEVNGVPITLGTLAHMEVVTGPAEIHRLGSKRVAIVSANLSGRDLGSVTTDIRARLRDLTLPGGVSVEMGGQNEEMDSSFRSLRIAILLAVFLVYLVMAAQFESFVYPLIIMFTVPLAMSGAVYGLYLRGLSVSVIAIIGAIMLAGIVVNNGIVLVDRINQLRQQKMHLAAAVVQAGSERLRPILMTTATTVLGLMPMALGLGEGAELRAPLAVTVISGLLLATLLTLVVVPVIYTLLTGGERLRTESGALVGAMQKRPGGPDLQPVGEDA